MKGYDSISGLKTQIYSLSESRITRITRILRGFLLIWEAICLNQDLVESAEL